MRCENFPGVDIDKFFTHGELAHLIYNFVDNFKALSMSTEKIPVLLQELNIRMERGLESSTKF